MTARERKLAVVLGVVVGVGVLYAAGKRFVVEPVRALDRDIARNQRIIRERTAELRKLHRDKTTWQQIAARSIAVHEDRADAQVWLDTQIKELLGRTKLRGASVTSGTPRRLRKTPLVTLPFTVSAEGTIDDLTSFLYELYNWPYSVKVTSLDVSQRGNFDSSRIKVEMKIEALLVPTGKDLPPIKALAERDPEKRPGTFRDMRHPSRREYNALSAKNIFRGRTQPRPPPVVKGPIKRLEERPTPTPVVRPSGREKTFVTALLSSPDGEKVVTLNELSKTRQVVAVGERLDGPSTMLVTIHPYGAIVRDDDLYYLYPLNASLAKRERIEEASYPQLWGWLHSEPSSPSAQSSLPSEDDLLDMTLQQLLQPTDFLEAFEEEHPLWELPDPGEMTDLGRMEARPLPRW